MCIADNTETLLILNQVQSILHIDIFISYETNTYASKL